MQYNTQFPVQIGTGFCFGLAPVPPPTAYDIQKVTLIRPASVTHSFDSDQRFINLEFTDNPFDNCQLNVTAPADGNIAPPGYYMLFVLAYDELVPSVAAWIKLE